MSVPNFYILKAATAFSNAYAEDENVVSVVAKPTHVTVTLRDLDSGVFPWVLDGVSITYRQEDDADLEDAS